MPSAPSSFNRARFCRCVKTHLPSFRLCRHVSFCLRVSTQCRRTRRICRSATKSVLRKGRKLKRHAFFGPSHQTCRSALSIPLLLRKPKVIFNANRDPLQQFRVARKSPVRVYVLQKIVCKLVFLLNLVNQDKPFNK